jgi:hypothetical protein
MIFGFEAEFKLCNKWEIQFTQHISLIFHYGFPLALKDEVFINQF